ncbi:MAG: hypothetical protein AAF702_37980 [Chloroflexota bacterium]
MKQNHVDNRTEGSAKHSIPIIWALLANLLFGPLLTAPPLLAQDGTNTGQVHVNENTTFYSGGQLTNNTSSTFTNDGDVVINGSLDFQNGEIDEEDPPNTGVVIFWDNATASNASDASHVDGLVRKIGDDAFTFPTGDGGQYGPAAISAPGAVADQVDVRYWLSNPQVDAGPVLGTGLTAVSSIEYWNVDGSPSVDLTLHWDSGSNIANLGGGSLPDLRIVGWDTGTSEWVNLGNDSSTGDATSGTITANGITPNSYAAYTFGTVAVGSIEIDIALSPDPVGVSALFTATITLTNTGATNIITLPFQLDYDTADAQFFPSTVSVDPDDFGNDGTLNWSDLTSDLGDLIPNTPVMLTVQFTAIQDTTSNPVAAPCNVAGESCLSIDATNVQDGSGTVPTATANDAIAIDIGLTKYTLGDLIWLDESKDGLKNQGEAGINGVLLNLYLDGSGATSADGVPQNDEWLASTSTANNPNSPEISADGYYSFSVTTGPGTVYIVAIDESNFEQDGALEGMIDTEQQGANQVVAAAIQATELVVPMTSPGDYLDADFGFAAATANLAIDVMVNTVGPARQTDPISFTVTITNLDAAPLSSLPVDVVFPDAYLDCTSASQTPSNVVDNQMGWADLLGTAGVTLNQNDPISFVVNCTAGLDTTLLPNQQAELQAIAANASDSDGISIFAPTAVLMAERSIRVDRNRGQVTLVWQSTDESQVMAFNVYRRWVGDSDWTLLNNTAIVAERSSQAEGGRYAFSDQLLEEVVAADVTSAGYRDAHYRLGLLMVDGSEQFLDLGNTEANENGAIFLPFVTK